MMGGEDRASINETDNKIKVDKEKSSLDRNTQNSPDDEGNAHARYLEKKDKKYFIAMGWNNKAPTKSTIERTLDRAHQTRNFEIELYWKRANYFWILQAAVFTAFGLSISAENIEQNLKEILPIIFSCLGFLCAYAGYLSAQASKFWQKNWEKHIDMLEDQLEGHLYKTVWIDSNGVKHSISNLNGSLVACFNWFWLALILYFCGKLMFKICLTLGYTLICPCSYNIDLKATFTTIFILLTIFGFIALRLRWSALKKHNPANDDWFSRKY